MPNERGGDERNARERPTRTSAPTPRSAAERRGRDAGSCARAQPSPARFASTLRARLNGRAKRDRAGAGDVEVHRLLRRPLGKVGAVQRLGGRERSRPHVRDGARGQPIGRVARRVIRVAVADRGEIQPGDPGSLEYREVRVARQAPVDLRLVRASARRARGTRPRADQPAVPGPRLEQRHRAVRAHGVEVDVRRAAAPLTSGSRTRAAAPISPSSSASVSSTITACRRSRRAASSRAHSSATATPSASSPAPGDSARMS